MPWQPIRSDGFTVLLRDLHTMISRESAPKEVMLWMVESMQRQNGDQGEPWYVETLQRPLSGDDDA
jgi:hypothetical protein